MQLHLLLINATELRFFLSLQIAKRTVTRAPKKNVCVCIFKHQRETFFMLRIYAVLYSNKKTHLNKILELVYRYIVTGCIFYVLRNVSFDMNNIKIMFSTLKAFQKVNS